MIEVNPDLSFSGERFRVLYSLHNLDEEDARMLAHFICVEQTAEFPYELIPPGPMRDNIVGQIDTLTPLGGRRYEALISYAVETAGHDLVQLFNVIFGNISFVDGVRVERVEFPSFTLEGFKGPRFGTQGIRALLGIGDRPMVSTALKPMGLSAAQLAQMAYRCALGGLDLIKDDHGLSDQTFSPFRERIDRCVEAVARANQETGYRTMYFACISGPMDQFHEKVSYARDAGVDGLMIMPGFAGIDTMRVVAENDSIGLPVMFHSGFLGSFRRSTESGLSPHVLHGQLARLAGADISIFPHYGGRFAPPQSECQAATDGTRVPMDGLKACLPSPAGGVRPESFTEMREFYGHDVVFLVAGNLHRHGPDLTANSRDFRAAVEQLA